MAANLDALTADIKKSTVKNGKYTCGCADTCSYGVVVKNGNKVFHAVDGKADSIPSAVIVGKTMVLNGDQSSYNLQAEFEGLEKFPTLSFRCLARFFNKAGNGEDADIHKVINYLANGKIKVLDSTYDNHKYQEKSPGASYTLVAPDHWHRAGSVLVQYNQRLIIFGQDEGSYFGSEIPYDEKVNTIDKAFKALMPKSIRNRKDLKRQGEWFAVPVEPKKVPDLLDCTFSVTKNVEECAWLPRDSQDSARHYVYSVDIRVGKDGFVYAFEPQLSHEHGDHEVLHCDDWVKFVRNTAIRSYSEEGVD